MAWAFNKDLCFEQDDLFGCVYMCVSLSVYSQTKFKNWVKKKNKGKRYDMQI